MKKILSIVLLAIAVLSLNSCVKDEPYPYASVAAPSTDDGYLKGKETVVEAKVSALVDVESVTLKYATDGKTFKDVPMTLSGKNYVGAIPAQADGTEVTFYVVAKTVAGKESESAKAKFVAGKEKVSYKGLVLNELNGSDKFIELYNGSDKDIDLTGVKMYKDAVGETFDGETWVGSMTIKKGEYLVLWTTGTADIDPAYIFNSGLSGKKAVRITICDPDGKVIDDFNTSNSVDFKGSMGRNADGKWYYQDTKSPGAKNVDGTELLPML
ncbi:lamin tail domain-containing protein [Sodaliphilus sp.]|uniref:lamin tail domain-containing protein n=1 Tax=Sodaliphilus sp. TaxID=2815818 RepID=UPI003890D43C